MKYQIKEIISKDQIRTRVFELGKQITSDFENQEIHLIGVLKGSVLFMADLIRSIDLNSKMDYVKASSYGNEMVSNQNVKIERLFTESLKDKNVIIIEDIIDTGHTIETLVKQIKKDNPKQIKVCSLLNRAHTNTFNADYIGFNIKDEFVAGYGIDYAQKYRNLSYIAEIVVEKE